MIFGRINAPGENVKLPDEILLQHIALLGKTRSGKSSVMRLFVERLLGRKERVVVVDPKGDWFGLKLGADGKSPGFPVVTFGDFREPSATDVPITKDAGRQVAELIAGANRPCIIGLRGWTVDARTSFWIDFASTLFNKIRGSLHLVVDEVHNFAPKQTSYKGTAGTCVHWSNRLASEGLGLGIKLIVASQRPQKVHNDLLTSCETLVALRVIHPSDRSAVKAWIDGCGDPSTGAELLNTIASMDRGEGWLWSPECGFGPKRIKFPMFDTFDSFAEPAGGKSRTLKGWAEVDLDEVKGQLAAVVERATVDDPKRLHAEIARLTRELNAKQKQTAPVVVEKPGKVRTETVSLLTPPDRKMLARIEPIAKKILDFESRLSASLEPLAKFAPRLDAEMQAMARDVSAIMQRATAAAKPVDTGRLAAPFVSPRQRPTNAAASSGSPGSSDVGTGAARALLTALAQFPVGLTAKRMCALAGVPQKKSTYRIARARIGQEGWATVDREPFRITEAGLAALGPFVPLPIGEGLLDQWRTRLGDGAARQLFDALASAAPGELTRVELGAAAGVDPTLSTYRIGMAKLKSLGVIERHDKDRYSLSAELQ